MSKGSCQINIPLLEEPTDPLKLLKPTGYVMHQQV